MEREKATERADLPHEFEGSIAAPVICRICTHSKAHELHTPTPETASDTSVPREIGS